MGLFQRNSANLRRTESERQLDLVTYTTRRSARFCQRTQGNYVPFSKISVRPTYRQSGDQPQSSDQCNSHVIFTVNILSDNSRTKTSRRFILWSSTLHEITMDPRLLNIVLLTQT